ncbi:MAG: long-chain fatty acid--CoA ligase [Saprospiraceae bacterium]|nr:long-chain fatty acid--CoA ligase [Saprospiraceae bacterium]
MQVQRLFDFIQKQINEKPLEKFIGSKVDGHWKFYSTLEIQKLAKELANGLIAEGIMPGDKVGIVIYKNRPEWVIADLAIQYVGAIGVPMYPTISIREYEYIMNEAEVRLCFVGIDDLYDKVSAAQAKVPFLKNIVCFDKQGGRPYWKDYLNENHVEEVEKRKENVKSEDLATIIYTSGTTGNPKGVMLTHANVISIVDETMSYLPLEKGYKTLSFLPFCHIFERAVIYGYTSRGVEMYCTGTDNLGGETGDLAMVKPHFFTTVPRLLEKVYEKIYNKGLALTGVKKKLFFWALAMTDGYEVGKKYSGWEAIQMKIADKLIFSKWRAALGGNLIAIVTGAAPCPAKIARVFSAAGIPILEGYGLTETSPTISINHYGDGLAKIGSVGIPIRGIEVYIDTSDGNYREGEGEILVSGPNIMLGYYKQEEQTAAVFKEINGKKYFMTGDIGMFVKGPKNQDFLKITDRKKELLKTSGGKYVAPAPIESKLKENFLIEQVMVVGDNQKFVSALITPSVEALQSWCSEHEIAWTNVTDVLKNEKVIQLYQSAVDEISPNFSQIEQIKKFVLVAANWEPVKTDGSESELTPTMKLKRRVIMDKYREEISRLYF